MNNSNDEIEIFQGYLQIPSVHPNVDYGMQKKKKLFCNNTLTKITFKNDLEPCVKYIQKQAQSLNLTYSVHYPANHSKPVIIVTWIGTDPELSSILLNSHMDVVPVFEEFWTHPPFAAEIDADGRIFARGAQDMKSVGMQYLAAIRKLKNESVQLKRTVHIGYYPGKREFVM